MGNGRCIFFTPQLNPKAHREEKVPFFEDGTMNILTYVTQNLEKCYLGTAVCCSIFWLAYYWGPSESLLSK